MPQFRPRASGSDRSLPDVRAAAPRDARSPPNWAKLTRLPGWGTCLRTVRESPVAGRSGGGAAMSTIPCRALVLNRCIAGSLSKQVTRPAPHPHFPKTPTVRSSGPNRHGQTIISLTKPPDSVPRDAARRTHCRQAQALRLHVHPALISEVVGRGGCPLGECPVRSRAVPTETHSVSEQAARPSLRVFLRRRVAPPTHRSRKTAPGPARTGRPEGCFQRRGSRYHRKP
jgi:hypothetical protein